MNLPNITGIRMINRPADIPGIRRGGAIGIQQLQVAPKKIKKKSSIAIDFLVI